MQNSDEAWPSISPVGRGQLVKMLINIEPHGIFWSTFAYLYNLTLSGHWYSKRERSFTEQMDRRPCLPYNYYWTALTDTDCSSIYTPNLSSMHV